MLPLRTPLRTLLALAVLALPVTSFAVVIEGVNDDPKTINAEEAVVSTLDVQGCERVTDVNVGLTLSHDDVGDLKLTLITPDDVGARLYDGNCTGSSIDTGFDDESENSGCPPTSPSTQSFDEPLSDLNDLNGNGTWWLQIENSGTGTGTLQAWGMQLTCEEALEPPALPALGALGMILLALLLMALTPLLRRHIS